MPKKIVTWVLVADGARARIYVNDGPGKGLKPVGVEFDAGLPHSNRDVMADREGRSWTASGTGRHAMERKTDPKRQIEQNFARDVAQHVGQAALEKKFDRLVLVAAPKALGDLRGELPRQARDLITQEVDKDLVNLAPKALEKHLTDAEVLV